MRRRLCSFALCLTVLPALTTRAEDKKVLIPRDAEIAVEPMGGFEFFVMAALYQRDLPVTVVSDPQKADYVVRGKLLSSRASFGKVFLLGTDVDHLEATLKLLRKSDESQLWEESSSRSTSSPRLLADAFVKHLARHTEGPHRPQANVLLNPKVYLAMGDPFKTAFREALHAKQVPVTIVNSPEEADYLLQGVAVSAQADTRKKLIMLNWQSREQAAIAMVDKAGTVLFSYGYFIGESVHGLRSSSESCAKHLGDLLADAKKRGTN